MRTLQVIYSEGKQRLQKAGNESPAFDTICLFEHVFHMNRQDLMMHGNTKQATPEQEAEFFSVIEQRANKCPLQYILGEWPFLDFQLKMGEGVLIAREDTTVLVETAAKLIQGKQPEILDLCAGTGAVGLGLASLLSTANVTCVEKYAPALRYLKENIALCKKQGIEHVTALQGDILSESFASAFQSVDGIVSNPPYIEENDEHLKVLSFEPISALTSGKDGLDDIRIIARDARQFLNIGGALLLEHGYNQGKSVRDILTENGYREVNTLKDLGGNERVTYGLL